MGRNDWDCLMLNTKAGTHRKLRRLTDSEWRAFVGGVLAVAAESPVRGVLLIEEGVPAEAADVAAQAGVETEVAIVTLAKCHDLKLIETDPKYNALAVIDWFEWNPPSPKDKTGAKRQQEWRDRQKQARDEAEAVTESVTRNVTDNGSSNGKNNAALKKNARSNSNSSRKKRGAAQVSRGLSPADRLVEDFPQLIDLAAEHEPSVILAAAHRLELANYAVNVENVERRIKAAA